MRKQIAYQLDKNEIPDLTPFTDKVRRKIMYQAAKVIALRVREIVPDSGQRHKNKLKYSIRYGTKDAGFQGVVSSKAPHAWLVENGVRPHFIPSHKQKEELNKLPKWLRKIWHKGFINHPGYTGYPFLMLAIEDTHDEVERVLKEAAEAALAEMVGG